MAITQEQARNGESHFKNEEKLRSVLDNAFNFSPNQSYDKSAEDLGLDYLGSGCYRAVYSMDGIREVDIENPEDYVVKIETKPQNNANEAAVDVVETLPEHIVEEFCVPIRLYDERNYTWIVMEKAKTNPDGFDFRDFEEELREEGYFYDDVASTNVGIHDGQTKLVDYGHNWETIDGEAVVECGA